MFKYNKEAWNNQKVPQHIKQEFFEKFRDLCAYYGVYLCGETVEYDGASVPAILFEFYDGSEYTWEDGDLDYSNFNSFENIQDKNDVISVNGISFQSPESEITELLKSGRFQSKLDLIEYLSNLHKDYNKEELVEIVEKVYQMRKG